MGCKTFLPCKYQEMARGKFLKLKYMGYISEAKDIKQKRYGAYINHCKTLSIKPVSYSEFTETIYYDTYAKFIELIDKEG